MHRTVVSLAAALALAACAQSPAAIAPVSMGPAYDGISCQRAGAERQAAAAALADLSGRQDNAVAGDALGVFLIGVPVASLSGGDVSGLIALEKGKLAALDARLLACS